MPKDLNFTVSTSSIPFSNVGGDRNFTVTSNLDLELVTVDDATSGAPDWFSLNTTDFHSPGVIGKTESFKVTVEKNKSLKKRSGKVSIIRKSDGKEMGSVSVSQDGSFASVEVSAVSFNFAAQSKGQSKTLVVTSNVPVSIGSVDSDWLAVSPADVTHDDATVSTEKNFTLSVKSDNTGDQEREAKFNVTWTDENDKLQAKEITVVQMPKDLNFTVSTSSIPFSNVGGVNNFRVTSNLDLELVAVDDATGGVPDWFRLDKKDFHSPGVSGKTEPFEVTVVKNKSLKSRSGKVIIRRNDVDMDTVIVSQGGSPAVVLNKTSDEFSFNAKAEGEKDTLTVSSNVPIKISEIDFSETDGESEWLEVSPVSFSHDDATISSDKIIILVVKSENTNENKRVAKFNIVWTDEKDILQSKAIRVEQMGQSAIITVNTQRIVSSDVGLEETLMLTSNLNLELETVDNETNEEPDWFSIDKKTITSVGVTAQEVPIKVKIDRNITLKDRNGRIRIMRDGIELASVDVSQSKLAASLIPNPYEFKLSHEMDSKTIEITSNVDWWIEVSYVNGNDWLTVEPLSGGGYNGDEHKTNVTLKVPKNLAREDREANINIHWFDGIKDNVTVVRIIQGFETDLLSIDKQTSIRFNAIDKIGQQSITIYSNTDWNVSCSESWVKPQTLSGNGNRTIDISADKRVAEDYYQRTAMLYVETTSKSLKDSVIIYQSGTSYLKTASSSVPFTVKDDIKDVEVMSNVPWRVFLSEESPWLTIEEPQGLLGEGNDTIKLHADFNGDTESGRTDTICIMYLGPDGDSVVTKIPVTQKRCPIVPEELLLVDTLYTPDGVVEATIRESVNLVVDTTGYDNSDKWIFEWVVNGATQTSYANSLGYEMRDKQMYPVAVKIKYKDDPTNEVLQQSMEFELYPAPQIPTKLVKKGDGTSGIMIAEFVENNQFANDFNGKYEFIFGYSEDTQEGTTYNKYYQYSNKALVTDETVEKWVYTQWEIDNRLIQSKNKRSSTGKSIPNPTRSTTAVNAMISNHLEMIGNRLKVSLPNFTSAYVAVISMSGVVVRDFDLSSNEAINETLDFYELPPGAYIVKCNFGEQGIVKKIVIK